MNKLYFNYRKFCKKYIRLHNQHPKETPKLNSKYIDLHGKAMYKSPNCKDLYKTTNNNISFILGREYLSIIKPLPLRASDRHVID